MPNTVDKVADKAQEKGQRSNALGWGLRGLQQAGGALGAWNDSRAYTGFEEGSQVDAAIASDAVSRLAQMDIAGAIVSLLRGRELQARERRRRQKEKKLKLQTDLRELKRGMARDERQADKGYSGRLAQGYSEAQRYAFSLYQSASGVKSGTQERTAGSLSIRAEAAAEAPARYLAEKLDRLADVRNVLEQEIDDALTSHPGRLKHEEQLQAAIDDVMEL